MTVRKSLLEQALDVCLYAPVGLAIAVTEELPQLIDKGRTRVNSQLAMAKMVGSFAVAQGQREAERVVRQATSRMPEGAPFVAHAARGAGRAGDVDEAPWAPPHGEPEPTNGDGVTPASPVDGTGVTPMANDSADSAGAVTRVPQSGPVPGVVTSPSAPSAATPAGDAGALAIPGYDALSASHVVQRLGGLAADELEAVRTYEAATRGRRTILNRIAQLQAPGRS
jgi:hypothetical protein